MAASFLREAGIFGTLVVRCIALKQSSLSGSRGCQCYLRLPFSHHQKYGLYIFRSLSSSQLPAKPAERKVEPVKLDSKAVEPVKLDSKVIKPVKLDSRAVEPVKSDSKVIKPVTPDAKAAAAAAAKSDPKAGSNSSTWINITLKPVKAVEESEDILKEQFIPVTRRSIIRFLMEQKDFLNEDEKKRFDDFALALDSAIVNKYHGILKDLKGLFDPINPDKDTAETRQWTRRERLDNEFWLLQKLQDIMERARFRELEKSEVHQMLAEHGSNEGVRVTVNLDRYDVLRFWVLGKERPEPEPSLFEILVNRILKRKPQKTVEFYKRVIVAIRLKKDSKLMLKAFKEIPVNSLEKLLPDGTMKMNVIDKSIVTGSIVVASGGVIAKIIAVLASVNVDWMLLITLAAGTIGAQAWKSYMDRRNAYLTDVSRTLYFKNVTNNRGLLAMLVDRAEDEIFKQALLSYTFLLTTRTPTVYHKPSNLQLPTELGGLTDTALERKVEQWVKIKTGVNLEFDCSESVTLLKSYGILSEANDKMNVLPLEAALNCLPITPQSLIARSAEADITEGYDRDEYLETEHEFKEEDKRSKKYGWF